MARLSVAVPEELLAALRGRAEGEGQSFAECARRVLAVGLEGAAPALGPLEGETPLEEARRLLQAAARNGSVQAAVALERSLQAEARAGKTAASAEPAPASTVDDLAARRRRS